MRRETKPCPFYGMPCEYVLMAEKTEAQAAEIERLRAALREIAEHTTNPEGSGPAYGMVGKLVRIARAALEKRT